MKWLLPKNWKPIVLENSKIPVWLSKVAPLNIGAITLFPFVISRRAIDETTRRHETIHFQQALETLVVPFYLLYLVNWLWGIIKYRKDWEGQKTTRGFLFTSGSHKAYHRIKAEQEAYTNENDTSYLQDRKRFQWIWKYKV